MFHTGRDCVACHALLPPTECFVDMIPGRRHKLVSTQSLNCSFLYSIWRKMGSFRGFCPPIKKRLNKEWHIFLRETS